MDEYVDFVSESFRRGNTERNVRQKAIEKRVTRPFRIPDLDPRLTGAR